MQFKYPELLYALFLLVIPVLIHLFQLRRFQKVKFTNVKVLKAVKLQTRKSSRLKKWLILGTRLFLLACIIFAFAQPFIPETEDFNNEQETVIYIDNSFSMQAKGKNGSLLNEAIQDLLNSFGNEEKLSIYTNDLEFKNTTISAVKNELIQLSFSANQISYDAAYLKGKQLFSNSKSTSKNLILVSDFQQKEKGINFQEDKAVNLNLVQIQPNVKANVSIDSVYVKNKTADNIELAVIIKSNEPKEDISVSLFNNNELLAKNAVSLTDSAEVLFTIPNNTEINGMLTIEDAGLIYDNTFYFNIDTKPKINVLSINDSSNSDYLKRIYTDDEFDFKSYDIRDLNFNLITNQNLIVLNEIKTFSNGLITALSEFIKDGGSILIIPSSSANIDSYNALTRRISKLRFGQLKSNTKRITGINFDDPLLKNSFYTKVSNFQYPKVESSFDIRAYSNSILSFEDEKPFLVGDMGSFIFSSSLNEDNSNFKNSQLIVPVLYNIGLQSLKLPSLFYFTGKKNTIAIKTVLGQDDILTLKSEQSSIIPLQKTYSNNVVIETNELPDEAGIIQIQDKEEVLQNISFNHHRAESNLNYFDLENISNTSISNELTLTLDTIKSKSNVNALWKWFVIFALAFLLIEMLILKYFK